MTRRRKKKKSGSAAQENPTEASVPRSFVMHRGEIGKSVLQLEVDLRRVMEPYTALNLKVRKKNVLKDFVNVAGPIGVSHFLILSKTDTSTNFRIARLPRGPTLTFQVKEFSLMRDVTAIVRRPKSVGRQYKNPPLLVLNHFNNEKQHMKLMTTMFQNMFPSINIQKVKLSEISRCVLFNYNEETNTIDFRHYNIEAVPVGLSRGVKKIMKNKIPDLGSLTDISEYVTGSCYVSESEGEEPTEAHVTLPQNVRGRGNAKSSQSAIKLVELGPRLTLQLVKIEEGLCDGEVLFHQFVSKSEKEKKELKQRKLEKKKMKEARKKQQKENVQKKEVLKQQHKEKSLEGMKKKQALEDDDDDDFDSGKSDVESEEDDDTAYFRQEVGEDPDEEMFTMSKTKAPKRKNSFEMKKEWKKRKPNESAQEDKNFNNKRKFNAKTVGKKVVQPGFKKNIKFKGKGKVLKKKKTR